MMVGCRWSQQFLFGDDDGNGDGDGDENICTWRENNVRVWRLLPPLHLGCISISIIIIVIIVIVTTVIVIIIIVTIMSILIYASHLPPRCLGSSRKKQNEEKQNLPLMLYCSSELDYLNSFFYLLHQKTNSCLFSEEAEVNMEEGQERHLAAKAKPFHQPQPHPSLHLTTPHHLKTFASLTVLIYAPLPSTEQCTVWICWFNIWWRVFLHESERRLLVRESHSTHGCLSSTQFHTKHWFHQRGCNCISRSIVTFVKTKIAWLVD